MSNQELLEKMVADLQKQLKCRTDFFAGLSHELRNSIGILIGFAELGSAQELAREEQKHAFQRIHQQSLQMMSLLNEFLDLAKVDAEKMEFELQDVDVRMLVKELQSNFEPQCRKKNLKLSYDISAEVPLQISSDEKRIKQVLVNLVGNSIKFTVEGKIEIVVSHSEPTRLSGKNPHICFLINDSGIGIAENQKRKIFRSFTQADTSTQRRFGGTGLGLSLSRKIARGLGGDLKLIKSEVDSGSSFEFSLPCEMTKR